MDSKFNPYYEQKFIYLNQLLEKLKNENIQIHNENLKMEIETKLNLPHNDWGGFKNNIPS